MSDSKDLWNNWDNWRMLELGSRGWLLVQSGLTNEFSLFNPRRDKKHGYSLSKTLEVKSKETLLPIWVRNTFLWRRYVIIESTMLIISNYQESLIPLRGRSQSFIDVFHKTLTFSDTMIRMLVVHKPKGFCIDQWRINWLRRVNEWVIREIATCSIWIELFIWGE